MLTTTDIGDILYALLPGTVFHEDCFPEGEVREERTVIIVKESTAGTFWHKCFAEVNFLVPDRGGRKDRRRLGEIERAMQPLLRRGSGVRDGTFWRFDLVSFGVTGDRTLRAHYINFRLLFKQKNTL